MRNEQLHTLDFSPNVRVIKSTAGHVAYMGEMGNVYRVLVSKHEWNRSPGWMVLRLITKKYCGSWINLV